MSSWSAAIERHLVQTVIAGATLLAALAVILAVRPKAVWHLGVLLILPLAVTVLGSVITTKSYNVRYALSSLIGFVGLTGAAATELRPAAQRLVVGTLLVVSLWASAQWFFLPRYWKEDSRAVATYLSLWWANRRPVRSGMALAVSVLKPTFGLPLAFLMLARGTVRAVVIGVLLSLAINLPLFAVLANRAGGAREFIQVLVTGLQTSQQARNANPATSPHRVDVTALVSRGLQRPLSPAGQLAVAAGMLVLAALTLRRLARLPGRVSEDLAIAIACLSIALFGSHLGYDLVILAAPLAAFIVRGLPEPAGPITRWIFLGLYAVPAVNWLTTDSVLAAWRPSPEAWLLAASINSACVMALFLGYVTVAWLRRDVTPTTSVSPAAPN